MYIKLFKSASYDWSYIDQKHPIQNIYSYQTGNLYVYQQINLDIF